MLSRLHFASQKGRVGATAKSPALALCRGRYGKSLLQQTEGLGAACVKWR